MDEAVIKRMQPHSTEMERAVIASMLSDKDAVVKASEIVRAEDFYDSRYSAMYGAMIELYTNGEPVDLLTLQNKLKEKDVPPEITGLEFLRDLFDSLYIAANIEQYATAVAEKAVMRRLIQVTEKIAGDCYAGKDSLDDILADTETSVFNLLKGRTGGDYTPIREIALNTLEKIEMASRNKSAITGIPTGFTDLDYKTAGLQPSDLVLVAARPSMGKTAFVLNIAQYAALKKDYHVAIFSLEMSKEQLMNRLFSMESGVDSQALRTGNLSDTDWDSLVESVGVIGNSNLIIDDTSSISISEMRSKCRKFKLEMGLDLIIIDYLQLMSGSKRSAESRQQEISEISRSLKGLAREIGAPVIALSQLSRAVESRTDKRPMLSDLRESGAIEQDADVVMFIYRDDYYNKDTEHPNEAEIIIAKQRNGPIGTVNLIWLPDNTRFVNMERER